MNEIQQRGRLQRDFYQRGAMTSEKYEGEYCRRMLVFGVESMEQACWRLWKRRWRAWHGGNQSDCHNRQGSSFAAVRFAALSLSQHHLSPQKCLSAAVLDERIRKQASVFPMTPAAEAFVTSQYIFLPVGMERTRPDAVFVACLGSSSSALRRPQRLWQTAYQYSL